MSTWLVLAAAVMLGAVMATILATVGAKLRADRRGRRYRAVLDEVRPAVFAFVASEGEEPDELTALLRAAHGRDGAFRRRAVSELLTAYGGKLRGEVVARIRAFFVEHGFAEAAARDLGHRSPWKRALAAQELGFVADERFTTTLADALTDRDLAVRIVAARALGEIGDAAAAPRLVESQHGSRQVPYGAASRALLRIGSDGTGALRGGLAHPDVRVRRLCVDVLGELGVHAVRDDLLRILRTDVDTIVRIRAAHALGRLGTAEILAELYASMRDENADIRQSVVRAVADIGARHSVPVLRRCLADPDHATARTAAHALVAMGPMGLAVLGAEAAGAGRGSPYAIEALDRHEPVSEEDRARLRQWDPIAVAEPNFPTTRGASR